MPPKTVLMADSFFEALWLLPAGSWLRIRPPLFLGPRCSLWPSRQSKLEALTGGSAKDCIVGLEITEDEYAAMNQRAEAKGLQRKNPPLELFLEAFEEIRAKLSQITKETS